MTFCGKKPTLLIVDDNSINRFFLKHALTEYAGHILQAETGAIAVETALSHLPDIIYMDIHLPDFSGEDARRNIIAHWPQRQLPLLVAITADARIEERRRLLQQGFDYFLSKPLSLEQLNQHLSQVFANHTVVPQSRIANTDLRLNQSSALAALNQNPELLIRMYQLFHAELIEMVPRIEEHICAQQLTQAKALLHPLLSSMGYCGAERLRHLTGELETALSSADLNQLANVFYRWHTEATATSQALIRALGNAGIEL